MESTACSISFSYSNSIIDQYSRSGVRKIGKFQQTRMISFHEAVVISINGNNNRSSRGHELIRCFRNDCRSDLRSSSIPRKVQATMSSSKTNICKKKEVDESVRTLSNLMKEWSQLQLVKVAGLVGGMFLVIPSAGAFDTMKTFSCLLNECRLEFAKCMANPSCAANVTCIETCHNRPDESDCQIRCGDLFQNSVVDEFNMCVISRKKCVPKKSDVAEFPAPDPAALVKSFSIADFSGKWFISSGLNPTFDTFDCQLHEFHTEANKLVANLSWRIQTPDGGFFTRSAVQRFAQDPKQPAILHNHDNDYLHYQDDWYILSSKIEDKPDDYIFIYYRGKNDAWNGYGGAIVYTRSAVLPETILPELEKAAKSIGEDFNKFIRTDNTCGPEPTFVERLEKKVNEGKKMIIREAKEIKGQVERVGKTEKTLFQRLCEGFKELQQDVENVLRGLSKEETDLLSQLNMEAKQTEDLFGRALSIRKLR